MFEQLEKELNQKYPVGFIFRQDIQAATSGLINKTTISIHDTQGKGIKRFKLGSRVAYKISDVIAYLEGRVND